MILPEVYLDEPDITERIEKIHAAMNRYIDFALTREVLGMVYVERETSAGLRQGLVGAVDLEAYSYEVGAPARIRPSERTVPERIPPRLAVRRGACLESPHILMLADDPQKTIIEPIAQRKDELLPLYDVELMLGGGRVRGWAVGQKMVAEVQAAIEALDAPKRFSAMYGTDEDAVPFALAVGDGNHSLATAKAAWEELKPTLPPEQRRTHGARACLVELNNIQSPAIEIEPIHRAVFGVESAWLREKLLATAACDAAKAGPALPAQHLTLLWGENAQEITLAAPEQPLAVGSVDAFLQRLAAEAPQMTVDYIHGEDALRALAKEGAVGFLLPPFEKSDLFRGVALGGVLPRKTFSMGHATDKRYYLECRHIL
jgi:hypothetical protein